MTQNRSNPANSDWALVIKAQDDLSRNQILSDLEVKKLQKKAYKQALDQQLQYKKDSSKCENFQHSEESSFFTKQHQVLKDMESQKKNLNRLRQKEFLEANQENISIRLKNESKQQEKERLEDQERLKLVQKEIEDEWTKARQKRNLMIFNQQEMLRKQQQEKVEKKKFRSFEQLQEKLMIDDRVRQMRQNEQAYKEKYEKARNYSEKKSQIASPNALIENRDDLITRRYQDWEKVTSEKEAQALKNNEILRKRKIKDLQLALNSQLYEKDAKKMQEMLYDREFLTAACKNAKEESLLFESEKQKKLKTQELLKQAYDQQMREKHSNLNENLSMSPQEKQLHRELLEKLKEKKPVSFVSVPGNHFHDTPVRRRTTKRRLDSLPFAASFTPPPNLDQRQGSIRRHQNSFPDPYKHNPITNPIGSELEVFQSQTRVRGRSSVSKLALAGSFFLNNIN